MPLFVVIANSTAGATAVQAKIDSHYALMNYRVKPDTWIIQAELTSTQLAEQLGLYTGDNSVNGLVVKMSGYAGRGENDMWEWLNLRWEA